MLRTVDAVVNQLQDVVENVEWATVVVSGLSFSFAAVAAVDSVADLVVADSVETTACGLSFFYSAAAEAALAAEATAAMDVDVTVAVN